MELRAKGAFVAHQEWAARYGRVFASWGGSQPFVFTTDGEAARRLLMANYNRPRFLSLWSGKDAEFDRASILGTR